MSKVEDWVIVYDPDADEWQVSDGPVGERSQNTKGSGRMGKVSDWLIEMEEDASYMTRQEFMDKHGETVVEYYDELQLKWQYDHAEPGEPDDVG